METSKNTCRLCNSTQEPVPVRSTDKRSYHLCENCYLISAEKKHLLDKESEKARYATHQNGIQFDGYVDFLRQAIDPALKFISKDMAGLDYGCGPDPTLSEILNREGYKCENYDPFFVKHDLNKKFGFIFSTEVFEHFFDPGKEIQKIGELLDGNGVLIVMTDRWESLDHFSDWYYLNDSCHVCFYHTKTFAYICRQFGFNILFDDGKRVVILGKKNSDVCPG